MQRHVSPLMMTPLTLTCREFPMLDIWYYPMGLTVGSPLGFYYHTTKHPAAGYGPFVPQLHLQTLFRGAFGLKPHRTSTSSLTSATMATSIANTHTGTSLYTCPSGHSILHSPHGYSTSQSPHGHSTSHGPRGHSNSHSRHGRSPSHSPCEHST